jgi:hypothetical protein
MRPCTPHGWRAGAAWLHRDDGSLERAPLAAALARLAAAQIGSRTSKAEPTPRSLVAETVPPSASTTLRET